MYDWFAHGRRLVREKKRKLKRELSHPKQKMPETEETQSSKALMVPGPYRSQRSGASHKTVTESSRGARSAAGRGSSLHPSAVQCHEASAVIPDLTLWEDQGQP